MLLRKVSQSPAICGTVLRLQPAVAGWEALFIFGPTLTGHCISLYLCINVIEICIIAVNLPKHRQTMLTQHYTVNIIITNQYLDLLYRAQRQTGALALQNARLYANQAAEVRLNSINVVFIYITLLYCHISACCSQNRCLSQDSPRYKSGVKFTSSSHDMQKHLVLGSVPLALSKSLLHIM